METTDKASNELLDMWRDGNDAGNGYGAGNEDDTPREAADREGYTDICDITRDGVVVATDGYGYCVVIADDNGPWAVRVY